MNSVILTRRLERRYGRMFLQLTIGALLAIGAFNYLTDPFWIHRGPVSSYWRPSIKQISSRVAKGEVAARDAMDVALVGDSRTLYGLDPSHPALARVGSVYNLGMPAASVEEATRLMEVLVLRNPQPPELILWIIQPEFMVCDRQPKYHEDYRLSRLNPAQDRLSCWLHSLWSREATKRSIDFVKRRLKNDRTAIRGAEPESHFQPIVSFQTFDTACQNMRATYLSQSAQPSGVEMEEPVARMFQACIERGIQLEVIIPPSHAVYWESLERIDWTDRVELGKRTLVELAERANCKQANSPVRIWDFSGFTGPAAEEIPWENSPIRWHADPVHFTRPLGDAIISRVMNEPIPWSDFGKVLTPENVDQHLASWKRDLSSFANLQEQRRQLARGGDQQTVQR